MNFAFIFPPFFGFGFLFYFLPSIIALARSKRNTLSVYKVGSSGSGSAQEQIFMAKEQKEILRMFVRYAEMVSAQFGEMDYRIRILEAAMAADPHLTTYNRAVRDAKRREFPPGLPRQLSAIREAVEMLPD